MGAVGERRSRISWPCACWQWAYTQFVQRCLKWAWIRSGRLGVNTEVGLGGELFVHRFDHFVEIEGFFKHAACAE